MLSTNMTTSQKTLYGAVLIGLAIVLVGIYLLWPKATFGAFTQGATFGMAKIAYVSMNLGSGTGSTTSLLNTDANGRWYQAGVGDCTNLEAASSSVAIFNVEAATTTVANNGLQGNTNLLLNLNLATTSSYITKFSANATTTPSEGTSEGYWPTGTYLTFLANAVSTTSACTIGISYIPS